MQLNSTHHNVGQRNLYLRCATLCLLLCAVSFELAQAQGGVGSTRGLPGTADGIHIIQGRVHFPIEPPSGRRVKVRLSSTDLINQTTVTDDDGSFIFNRLPAGHYTITVEAGKEFDTAVEAVNIYREASPGGRNINVSINLKLKGAADAFAKIPQPARDLYAKGMEASAKGENKKAIELLSSAIGKHADFPQAHSELGVQYLKAGQADKAAESLQAALKLTPDDVATRLNYGIALLQQKKYAEAETQLREVLKKNDSLPTAHMYLGISLMSQQKLDEAEQELLRAISFKSADVNQAHRYLGGVYWGKRDYQRAADELEIYLKLVPKAPDAERTRAAIKELREKKN